MGTSTRRDPARGRANKSPRQMAWGHPLGRAGTLHEGPDGWGSQRGPRGPAGWLRMTEPTRRSRVGMHGVQRPVSPRRCQRRGRSGRADYWLVAVGMSRNSEKMSGHYRDRAERTQSPRAGRSAFACRPIGRRDRRATGAAPADAADRPQPGPATRPRPRRRLRHRIPTTVAAMVGHHHGDAGRLARQRTKPARHGVLRGHLRQHHGHRPARRHSQGGGGANVGADPLSRASHERPGLRRRPELPGARRRHGARRGELPPRPGADSQPCRPGPAEPQGARDVPGPSPLCRRVAGLRP